MITNQVPFKGFDEVSSKVKSGERPSIPTSCPSTIQQIIKSCWSSEAKWRPSFEEIIAQLSNIENGSISTSIVTQNVAATHPKEVFYRTPVVYFEPENELLFTNEVNGAEEVLMVGIVNII
jgi:hypothetical protein